MTVIQWEKMGEVQQREGGILGICKDTGKGRSNFPLPEFKPDERGQAMPTHSFPL